jgi:cytochrome c-type biogenesis protein CcmE
VAPGKTIRVGGLVEEGSVANLEGGGKTVVITDMNTTVEVKFAGLLPDLFREGQGVVTEGSLNDDGVLIADEVLAKHDENYMPPEVAESLKEQGLWADKMGHNQKATTQ